MLRFVIEHYNHTTKVSKSLVHGIEFEDIFVDVMFYIYIYTIYAIVTGILIQIGSLRCFKEAKTMNICCWYKFRFSQRGNIFGISNKEVFHHKLF